MNRRTYLAATGAGLASLGGCLGLPASSSGTPTERHPLVDSGAADYPHDIRVENSLDRDVTVTVTVDREGREVYRGSHAVAAGTDAVVAGITVETLPADARSMTVAAVDAAGRSAAVEVSVSGCLGNVVFFYGADGTLESTYSIC